ncbi:hypothetical protein JOC77_002998 [Peribacillus deserti]|uniref:Uncharacterized protein n=1 Tax=Peribacillus deserti TaxID=673318 RepID=A0ABS2QK46_9BACI|nr:hypothetical protein [Peribacillus deserti]MBM7693558.1 hypothetical protein [Peribacillus deserti]
MMLETYKEKITVLREQGEVEIPLEDCDMFYIEDTLKSLNLDFQKLIRPPKRFAAVKMLTIKLKRGCSDA